MRHRWPRLVCLGKPPKTTIVALFVSLLDASVGIAAFVDFESAAFSAVPGL
jgi:hypothetical protein